MGEDQQGTNRSARIQDWWKNVGAAFFAAQSRRLIAGGVLGSLLGILWHLLRRDAVFTSVVSTKWNSVVTAPFYGGLQSYQRELTALIVFIALAVAWYSLSKLLRRTRAWWAGIWSAMTLFSAFALFAILAYGPMYPKRIWAASLGMLAICLAVEHRRQLLRGQSSSIGNRSAWARHQLHIRRKRKSDLDYTTEWNAQCCHLVNDL